MDLVEQARALGKALQEDERYIAMRVAQQLCDEDETLQAQIGTFHSKREEINEEAEKEDRNEGRIQALNEEFRKVYGEIMGNEKMRRLNDLQAQVEDMVKELQGILAMSAQGENPETCVYTPACSGDCGGCAGCG